MMGMRRRFRAKCLTVLVSAFLCMGLLVIPDPTLHIPAKPPTIAPLVATILARAAVALDVSVVPRSHVIEVDGATPALAEHTVVDDLRLWLRQRVGFAPALSYERSAAWASGPYNGTATGTLTSVASVTGTNNSGGSATGFNNCMSNGHAGYLTVSLPSYSQSTGVTFECRFNTAYTGAGPYCLMGQSGSWYVGITSKKIQLSAYAITKTVTTTAATYNDGAWHTVAVVFDTSVEANLYVDGSYIGQCQAGGASYNVTLGNIGTYANSATYEWNGFEDEVCVTQGIKYTSGGYTPASSPFANSASNQIALWHLDDTSWGDSNVPVTGISAGTVSRTARSATSQTYSISGTSGGTAPYTYQFQMAPVTGGSVGSYSNIGSNSSSTTYTESGLTQGTTYSIQVVITDSTTPTAQTATSTAVKFTTVATGEIDILVIGDSNSQGYNLATGQDPGSVIQRTISVWGGTTRTVVVVNAAIFGTTSTDWASGGSDLTNAIASGNAWGCNIADFAIGTNDSKSTVNTSNSTYQTNVSGSCSALVTAGYTVFLDYPIAVSASPFVQSVLTGYQPYMDACENGTTIRAGDKSAPTWTAANLTSYTGGTGNSYYQADQVHLNEFGQQLWGACKAYPIMKYLGIEQSGGLKRRPQ